MNIKVTDFRIQQIIHNIADDFRFSSKHEKYAPFFYAVDGTHEINKQNYKGIIEYIIIAKKNIKKDITWKQKLVDENSKSEDQKLLQIMKTMEQELDELYDFLTTSNHIF